MLQADRVEIHVLVENWVDMLLPDLDGPHCVSRAGLIYHFDPKLMPPQAENGISLLVRATLGAHTVTILFDVGLTGTVLAHNLVAFDIDPHIIDHVIISHGHPDHYGGVHKFLSLLDRPVPIATHPDAFLPRYAVMGDGRTAPFYNAAFALEPLEREGGRVVQARTPLELGWGVVTTGEIPRHIDFEGPPSPETNRSVGLWQVGPNGEWRSDEVWDEQGLVIDVKDEGLVVLTGCAHAGVVNTVRRAIDIAGEKPIRAVVGGFHLGFPTTPPENVAKTVDALRELEVKSIMPMHCSGLAAQSAFSGKLPDRYIQPAVGTMLTYGS